MDEILICILQIYATLMYVLSRNKQLLFASIISSLITKGSDGLGIAMQRKESEWFYSEFGLLPNPSVLYKGVIMKKK